MRFLRDRSALPQIQLQRARSRRQRLAASPNAPNHDLIDRLQTCVQRMAKL